MSGRYLTGMADALRAAGLQVVEVGGWQTRARSSGGYASGRPWCVAWHHTASQASAESDVSYIVNADTAPISNLYLARDGCVWVCAGGATNTNGKGGPCKVSRGTVPADKLNEYAVSIEAANSGVGEPWPQVQIDAFFATSLALTGMLGLEPTDVCTHAEWAPGRKIDPAVASAVQGPWRPASINSSGTWSLDDIRGELRRRCQPAPQPPQPTPDPEEDEDMPFIIINIDTGQPALVYGSGRVTGIDGTSLPTFIGRYGAPIEVEAATFADFVAKSG